MYEIHLISQITDRYLQFTNYILSVATLTTLADMFLLTSILVNIALTINLIRINNFEVQTWKESRLRFLEIDESIRNEVKRTAEILDLIQEHARKIGLNMNKLKKNK